MDIIKQIIVKLDGQEQVDKVVFKMDGNNLEFGYLDFQVGSPTYNKLMHIDNEIRCALKYGVNKPSYTQHRSTYE